MKNPAVKVTILSDVVRDVEEINDAANEIYHHILAANVKFSITACALLGQLLAGCGVDFDLPK